MKRKTKEEFIADARKVHGNKFDYTKVEYINNKTKVCIICPIHGEFWQYPQDHTKGVGCSKCNGGVSHSNEEWLEKFKKVHGERYFYNIKDTDKLSAYSKIEIICPKHGKFYQNCMNHSLGQGCHLCADEYSAIKRSNTKEQFITNARKVHCDKYDYSKVKYINNHIEVCIICPIHGEFWQKPNVHLLNHGCPKCVCSRLETEIVNCLEDNKIEYIHQANKKILPWLKKQSLDFYLPNYDVAIECQGGQHFNSVEWFGGVDALRKTIERDKRKRKLCEENGIKLLYYSNLDIEYPYFVYKNKQELIKAINE